MPNLGKMNIWVEISEHQTQKKVTFLKEEPWTTELHYNGHLQRSQDSFQGSSIVLSGAQSWLTYVTGSRTTWATEKGLDSKLSRQNSNTNQD